MSQAKRLRRLKMSQLLALAVLLASTCAMWTICSPVLFVSGCDIPGARDYGSFADVLHCTRRPRLDCELVVVTTVFQALDNPLPYSPSLNASASRAVPLSTCFYAIVDRPTAEALFPNRTTTTSVECDLTSLGWNVVVVPDNQLPFMDPRRDSRVPKVLLHLFFPWAKYHFYHDGNIRLQRHPADLVRLLLIGNGTVDEPDYLLAMPRHQERNSVEEELVAVTFYQLDTPRVLQHQVDLYHLTNHPPMSPLSLGSVRAQAHKPLVRAFECLWWAHIAAHSRRDQLSMVKAIADLELLPRTTIIESKFFLTWGHAHNNGRAVNSASGVSPYMPLDPLPTLGRRLFLDFNTNPDNHIASGNSRPPLEALLNRTTAYDMQDGWEEVSLLEQAQFEPRSWLAAHDLVVVHLDVAPTDDRPAQLLRRWVADGAVMLVDLVLVEYATADPAQLRAPTMVDFRTTLRDVVENWGVPAMTHWNSSARSGWEERAWWLACRRHAALGRLARADKADKADKAWAGVDSTTTAQAWESPTAGPSSLWVIGAIALPISFFLARAVVDALLSSRAQPPTAGVVVARAVVGL